MPFAERTSVPVSKTRAEIEQLLAKSKASMYIVGTDHEKGEARVQFKAHERIIRFVMRLPDPKKMSGARVEQEERRVWRALLLVIKAKLESVASGIETFDSAFLAQIVMPNDATVMSTMAPFLVEAYKGGKMPKGLTAIAGEVVEHK